MLGTVLGAGVLFGWFLAPLIPWLAEVQEVVVEWIADPGGKLHAAVGTVVGAGTQTHTPAPAHLASRG